MSTLYTTPRADFDHHIGICLLSAMRTSNGAVYSLRECGDRIEVCVQIAMHLLQRRGRLTATAKRRVFVGYNANEFANHRKSSPVLHVATSRLCRQSAIQRR